MVSSIEKYYPFKRRQSCLRLILSCIALLISSYFSEASAQSNYTYILDQTTRFDKFGVEQGLLSDYITCMHMDKYGFIWIGSQVGVNLYNGNDIITFRSNPNNPESLPGGIIHSIFEEENGTMWFTSRRGLSKFNRANRNFHTYRPDSINQNSPLNLFNGILGDGDFIWLASDFSLFRFHKSTGTFTSYSQDTLRPEKGIYGKECFYIFIDISGTLWVCSGESNMNNYVLSYYSKESGTFTHFKNDPADPSGFPGMRVTAMTQDSEGVLWLALMGGGLLKLIDKEEGKFKEYKHDPLNSKSIFSDNLYMVYEDSKKNLWIGGRGGFSMFERNNEVFMNYPIPNFASNIKLANRVFNIMDDGESLLYLSTSEGFFTFNTKSKSLRHYKNIPEKPESLSDNYIEKIIIDPSRQVWVGTHNEGICRINPFTNTFKRIQKLPNFHDGLAGNHVQRIFADSDDNIWIASFREGIDRTKIKDGVVVDKIHHSKFNVNDPATILGNSIYSFTEDQDGEIWIGTDKGLNKYYSGNNKFIRFEHDPNDVTSITSGTVDAMIEDSYGFFWVNTSTGMNILDKRSGKFYRILQNKTSKEHPINASVYTILEDSHKELWFGGEYLQRLNRADTSFITFLTDPGYSKITVNGFSDMKEDDLTNLWIGTWSNGLVRYIRESDIFENITLEDGLSSNAIRAVEIDRNGDIWVSSNEGLSRINRRTHKIKNFNLADGLLGREFIHKSSLVDKDGWLYFGGRKGLMYFHPDSLKENTFIPPVFIASVSIAGQQRFFEKAIYELNEIELYYNENDLSFDFVALNYINPQKNEYAFMLEGYDEDWNYVGNRRTAYYTNLNPGTYTFRVKGSNNDGYWNEEGASLMVVIHPPFWKTWWAYSIYILAVLAVFLVIRRNEIRKLHLRQQAELNNTKAESLAQIDAEKTKFFANVSHEFRTPLTLILGPLEKLLSESKNESEKGQLSMIQRNAQRLQALINQLLSLSKLESGNMKFKARPENVVKLTRLLMDSFHSLAVDRDIKIEFESEAEEYIVYIDKLKFEKIVNNLLSNAFKFTEKGGKIKVSVSSDNVEKRRGVTLKFSDTGIGIRKERLQHVFDRFYQVDEQQKRSDLGTGIGLALTKELVELHHGEISVESEFGMGTTFTVIIPIGKDHLAEDEVIESATPEDEMDDEMLQSRPVFVPDVVTKTGTSDNVPADSQLPLLLIVEDNADMRAYIKSYLVDAYQIIEAADGMEGAEMAINHMPDLIVSDLMMPKVDGNEMTQQLKNDERTSHIPVILLTAKASTATKLEGLETGADDFLTKPFDATELLIRIKNLIEQRQRLRKLLSKHIGNTEQTHVIQESCGKAMGKLDMQFLEKAKASIDQHMANPEFSVEMLAQELAMSRSQLHRKLKSLVDVSATDFIRDIRLQKAVELLREGDLNITQISYEIGISSLSYFSKAFKEKYGVTPSEFV